jgi:hypothetical protein
MSFLELWGSSTARELAGVRLERRTSSTMNILVQYLGLSGLKMLIICPELQMIHGLGILSYSLILVVCFS